MADDAIINATAGTVQDGQAAPLGDHAGHPLSSTKTAASLKGAAVSMSGSGCARTSPQRLSDRHSTALNGAAQNAT